MARHETLLLLGSKHGRLSEPICMTETEEWAEQFTRQYRCTGITTSGKPCSFPRREYQAAPLAVEPMVYGDDRGSISSLSYPLAKMFRFDARGLFESYLPASCVWSRVRRWESGAWVDSNYWLCQPSWSDRVDFYRGTTPIAPTFCPTCEQAYTWAATCRHMGILRHQVRDRPVLISRGTMMCVHPEFYHDMKLPERFPDIKIVHKIKIYDRDPHGWVLPGDPDWDGVFRKPKGWVDPLPADPNFL